MFDIFHRDSDDSSVSSGQNTHDQLQVPSLRISLERMNTYQAAMET